MAELLSFTLLSPHSNFLGRKQELPKCSFPNTTLRAAVTPPPKSTVKQLTPNYILSTLEQM